MNLVPVVGLDHAPTAVEFLRLGIDAFCWGMLGALFVGLIRRGAAL